MKHVLLLLFVGLSLVLITAIISVRISQNFHALPYEYSDNSQTSQNEFSEQEFSESDKKISLIAAGDISFSRGVERTLQSQKNLAYPFIQVNKLLQSADIVFANLETPITQGRNIQDGEMVFRSNPGSETILKNAHISIVSLANNHTPDFGKKGLLDTFQYLDSSGIAYIGAGKNETDAFQSYIMSVQGIIIAFLGYNDPSTVPASYQAGENRAGTAFMDIEKMTGAVIVAKQKADFVIVSMHAGTEYANIPNKTQTTFARAAIDAGADIIIGHHPHVVQTFEKYNNKYIFYSLGNFIMDQAWSQETREGLLIKIIFNKLAIDRIYLYPFFMEQFAQPKIVSGAHAGKILSRLQYLYEEIESQEGKSYVLGAK